MFMTEPATENRRDEAPRWYVLTVPRTSVQTCQRALSDAEEFNLRSGSRIACFAPTFVDMRLRNDRRERVRKPLVYNYVFMRGTLPELRRFHAARPVYNLLPVGSRRNGPTDYCYVPDEEMQQFMQLAQVYENTVPCFAPSEIDLQQGDRVRIIGGPFSGIEGVLLSRQGRDGGRVIVRLADMLAVETLDIAPEYLQIVEFARGGRHIYDTLDSYLPKARRALRHFLEPAGPDRQDLAAANYFLTRCGTAAPLRSPKIRGKYMALLMLSHRILGRTQEYERCRQAYIELLPRITNPETRAMTLGFLYACSREPEWLRQARAIADGWGDAPSLSPARRTIAEELTAYEKSASALH